MRIILQTKSQTIQLNNVPQEYQQLVEELQSQYLYEIQNVVLKYQDSDNDIISIENTSDLLVAYEYSQEENLEELLIFTSFEMTDKLIKQQENEKLQNSEFVNGQKLENSFVIESSYTDAEIINSDEQEKKNGNCQQELNCNVNNYMSEINLKKFGEIFKSIEINPYDITIKCSKCQFYKENISCEKCRGTKTIHPTVSQCSMINAILNYKIEKTLEQFIELNMDQNKKEN